jgi:hypothetical protein
LGRQWQWYKRKRQLSGPRLHGSAGNFQWSERRVLFAALLQQQPSAGHLQRAQP